MKLISVFILLLFCIENSFAQSGEWVWMKGDSTLNVPFYGDLGNGDSSFYHPPSLYQASSWTDDSGYLYLVDGLEYDAFDDPLYYDDIWRFNAKTNNWQLIKTSPFINSAGVYGKKGIPDSNNYPGSREGGILWKDHEGMIWLFGGDNLYYGTYNDLWKYNPVTNEWAWMSGPDKPGVDNGVFGTKGVPSPNNTPSSRRNAASWIDDSDNLWLFGGGCPSCFGGEFYQDLWKYNTRINEWTWESGTDKINVWGVNGIKGVPDTANIPATRTCSCSWSDDSDNFYLLGGTYLLDYSYILDDMWKYNPSTQQWTWLQGPEYFDSIGTFGTDCIYANENKPTTRSEEVCIKMKERLWLFSGFVSETNSLEAYTNDIWIYNLKLNQWTRVYGTDDYFAAVYGQQEVPSPSNKARGRFGAIGWFDQSGNFWCYGGDAGINSKAEGDLWKYIPDTTCTVITSTSSGISKQTNMEVYPNPASNEITISFPFSNNIITISDLYGRVLKQFKVESGNSKIINTSFLQAGVYLLSIEDENGNLMALGKLFKE